MAAMVCLVAGLTGCSTAPTRDRGNHVDTRTTSVTTPGEPAASPTLQRLRDEAAALMPLAQSSLTTRFLAATSSLPPVASRTVYVNEVSREYFSPAAKANLAAATQAKLAEVTLDEYRYYYTKYGSPLAYIRPLDLVYAKGFTEVSGKLIADFGYGGIGQLRLLASLGAHVTGIDPDSYLSALYFDRRDQGGVAPARDARRGAAGSITLAHGYWPKDPKMIERVGQGFDLILSKNTLKKGYVKPDRKIDKRQMVDLGVSDEAFLNTVYNTLNPGGMLMIYNISPKQQDKGYNPQADGRSPYSREQFEKSGFEVIAYNAADDAAIRTVGRALRWDRNAKDEVADLEGNLFALYTLVRRPNR
jgi:hypothetical protein